METAPSKFLFLFLMSIFFVCSSGSLLSGLKDFVHKELKRAHQQTWQYSNRRELIQTIQHDFMNPPMTTFPTTPVTNPVTTPSATITAPPDTSTPPTVTAPPDTSTPPIVGVPSANPVTATPTPVTIPPVNPATPTPVTIPSVNPQVPITNPVTTPTIPVSNPVTTYPITTPAMAPPVITGAPVVPGQSWCVARSGLPENALQTALDYACGIGGADCSAIQQGANCYNPNSMQNHASYAFNSYYQKNPVETSCDFGGTAAITNVNPSSGSCVYTTWSSSSSGSPTSASPITTTPTPTPTTESSSGATTPAGLGTPPAALNASNPALGLGGGITGGEGESPPTASTSSVSMSSNLQPFIGCIIVVISIITWRIVLDI